MDGSLSNIGIYNAVDGCELSLGEAPSASIMVKKPDYKFGISGFRSQQDYLFPLISWACYLTYMPHIKREGE